MRFTLRSPDRLFTDPLRDYCEEKLTRPVQRHRLDGDAVAVDLDATQVGERIELRVRLSLPHLSALAVTALHEDAYAAIDLAADRLERKLRDAEEKRRAQRRRAGGEIVAEDGAGGDAIFTEDEEDTLRQMGALDAVLES